MIKKTKLSTAESKDIRQRTEQALANHRHNIRHLALLEAEIEDLKSSLATESIRTVNFDGAPSSGTGSTESPTEKAAFRCMALENRLAELGLDAKELKYRIRSMERALDSLEPLERQTIQLACVDGLKNQAVAEKLGYSSINFIRKRALENLGETLTMLCLL